MGLLLIFICVVAFVFIVITAILCNENAKRRDDGSNPYITRFIREGEQAIYNLVIGPIFHFLGAAIGFVIWFGFAMLLWYVSKALGY